MEPLSVLASVTGILAVAAKITTVVTEFIQSVGDVPASTRSVLAEVSDLSLCLSQLTPFLRGTRTAERNRRDSISVEQVVTISTSLVMSISELEKLLDSFKLDLPMAVFARVQWVRNEEKINWILNRIRASRSSLNLILTIFTCTSMEAVQTSICNLVTTVEHILQASEDVSSRLARIETMFAAPSRHSASTLRAPIENANAIAQPQISMGEPLKSDLSRRILQFDPNLETELHASRVYMRTKHRHSTSSLASTYDSGAGLSFLSGISLAQISSISVISLPIFSYELWNPQQYTDIRSTDMSASLSAQTPTYLTSRSRSDASDTNIRGLAPKVSAGILGSLDGVQVKTMLNPQLKDNTRSARIDQMLNEEKNRKELRTKMLILGAGISGKSTVLKQMRLTYSEGFSLEEKEDTRDVIFSNIITAFLMAFEQMEELGLRYMSKATSHHENVLREVNHPYITEQLTRCSPKYLSAMKAIYADAGFQKAIERGNEYALYDNFQYYMAHIDRVLSPHYLPDDKDVLSSRVRTLGVTKMSFEYGRREFNVFDVGGARAERKKWVHLSGICGSLLFVASLAGYNECLVEDKTANQMRDALYIFEGISVAWFETSAITLLLTKLDLFEERIKEKPIRDYFPDYTGCSDDSAAGLKYFVGRFLSLNKIRDREIQVFCTDVTDTQSFKPILETIMDTAIGKKRVSSL